MKVALWAEIRRLADIERLSGRAISRRLRCSRDSVAAAIKLDQPPVRRPFETRRQLLARTRPGSTPYWLGIPNSRRCESMRRSLVGPMAIPAVLVRCGPVTCGQSAPLAVVFTRRFAMSRFRRCRSIGPSVAGCRSGTRCAKYRLSSPCFATAD